MFWSRETKFSHWEAVEDAEETLNRINNYFRTGENTFALAAPSVDTGFAVDGDSPGEAAGKIRVLKMSKRPLRFLPDGYNLVELCCDPPQALRYATDWCAAYFVLKNYPRGENNAGDENRDVRLITWNSVALYDLLRTAFPENCAPFSDFFKSEKVEIVGEYLEFFCSFLANDVDEIGEGTSILTRWYPFLVPPDAKALDYEDDDALEDLPPDFLQKMQGRCRPMPFYKHSGADKWRDITGPAVCRAVPVFPSYCGQPRQNDATVGQRIEAVKKRIEEESPWRVDFEDRPGDRINGTSCAAGAGEEAADGSHAGERIARIRRLVIYRQQASISTFEISGNGLVKMVGEEPVCLNGSGSGEPVYADRLPNTDYEIIRHEAAGINVVIRRKLLDEKDANRFSELLLEKLKVAEKADEKRVTVSNMRILGDARIPDCSLTVEFKDVEITGNLELEHRRYGGSLRFRNCSIGGRIRGELMTVNGNFHLFNVRVYGVDYSDPAYSGYAGGRSKAEAGIMLADSYIRRRFSANKVACRGRMDLTHMRVDGRLEMMGLQVFEARGRSDPSETVVDLTEACVAGSLDISTLVPVKQLKRIETTRTYIEGTFKADKLQAGSFEARGVAIKGHCNLSSAKIAGPVSLTPLSIRGQKGFYFLGVIMGGSLKLDRASMVSLWAQGLCLSTLCQEDYCTSEQKKPVLCSHSLSLVYSVIDKGLFWDCQYDYPVSHYLPAFAGAGLLLSGLRVGGQLRLRGVDVRGALKMVSGHVGQLALRGGIIGGAPVERMEWADSPARDAADKAPSPLISRQPSYIKGADFTDVTIGGSADFQDLHVEGRLEFRNIHVTGDILFWERKSYHDMIEGIRKEVFKDGAFPEIYDHCSQRISKHENQKNTEYKQKLVKESMLRAIRERRSFAKVGLYLKRVRCDGNIYFGNFKTPGRILFRNTTTYGDVMFLNSLLKSPCHGQPSGDDDLETMPGNQKSQCEYLSYRNAAIGGDLDLTGLEIRCGGDNDRYEEGRREGYAVNGEGAAVGGTIYLWKQILPEPNPATVDENVARGQLMDAIEAEEVGMIVKGGSIGLDGMHAERCVISADNFLAETSGPDTNTDVGPGGRDRPSQLFNLSRSRFSQITIKGFTSAARGDKTFPAFVDLKQTTTEDWDIDPNAEAIPLLKATVSGAGENDRTVDGRIFLDFEKRLRRLGKVYLADDVYRLMLKKTRTWDGQPGLQKFLISLRSYAGLVLTHHNTKPWFLLVYLLFLGIFVTVIFRDEANLQQQTSQSVETAHWGWTKAAGIAARYGIPFFPSGKIEPVNARLNGPTYFPVGLQECPDVRTPESFEGMPPIWQTHIKRRSDASGKMRCIPLSPHDAAMVVSAFQFTLWLVFVALIPQLFRRRE